MPAESMRSPETFVRRATRAWNTFWFRPSDPTTLGLMRILVGIVVVYVHLAYTKDLQGFFGKDGWASLDLVQDLRHEVPVVAPSLEWEDAVQNIMIPGDPSARPVFFDWLRNLPANREQRKEQLAYLYNLPHNNLRDTLQGIALAQYMLIRQKHPTMPNPQYDDFRAATDSDRQELLNALADLPKDRAVRDSLVPLFIQNLPAQGRLQARDQLVRFVATFPREPENVARIMGHFTVQAAVQLGQRKHTDPRTDLERTLVFIANDLPDDMAQRDYTLAYLGRWGLDPNRVYARGNYTWSIFFHVTDPTAMLIIHLAFIGIMIMFAAGLFTRVTSILTWLAALCYVHRTNQVLFGLDVMMNINLIYLMIGPSGAALSLDRWLAVRRARRVLDGTLRGDAGVARAVIAGPQPSVSANFATRLLQIHFCFIYAASGLSKLKGGAWWSHSAIWLTIANPEFSPTVFAPYRYLLDFLADHRLLAEMIMTLGSVYTLALEIGFPFLVWRPRLRPYMVMAGVLLHTGIAVLMGLTVFGLLMMTLLMSFIPPEVVRYWLEVGKGRLFSLRRGGTAPSATRLAGAAQIMTK